MDVFIQLLITVSVISGLSNSQYTIYLATILYSYMMSGTIVITYLSTQIYEQQFLEISYF